LYCHAFDDGLASNVTVQLSNATLISVLSQQQGLRKIGSIDDFLSIAFQP
jgi:hypothetical protein